MVGLRKRHVILSSLLLCLLVACSNTSNAPGEQILEPQAISIVAGGLDNPRGLSFTPNGALLIAESGAGGEGPCFEGPEGEACFGLSGSITRVWKGAQTRIVTGLPSIAAPDGSSATGPSDVSVHGNGNTYAVIGLGGDLNTRTLFGESGRAFGHLIRIKQQKGSYSLAADITAFEEANNPDAGAPSSSIDSNPYSVTAGAGGQVVADAGGNSLVKVAANGATSLAAVFPVRFVPAPPFLGLPPGTTIPMQSVPTSVVRGPDGAYYVGELTGFPFPVDAARVYRVIEGEEPEIYAEGFTNIIDIAFGQDGALYVLELATNSLLSGDLTGSLKRVEADGSVSTLTTLFAPGGLSVGPDGAFYISTCSVCPGAGEVIRYTP